MTKIYTTSKLNALRDKEDLGELRAEYYNFRKHIDRPAKLVFHDEQIPIPTTYDLVQPGAADTPPKWIGGGSLSTKWEKLLGTNQLSVKNNRWKGDPEPVKIVSGGGKVWKSQTDTVLTMGVTPVRIDASDYNEKDPKHEYMWRHFDKEAMVTKTGRKIDINWQSDMNPAYGSFSVKNMWLEELGTLKSKFYEDHESENFDIKTGNWQDVVKAHIEYFSELTYSITRKHRDSLPIDEARAIAMHAICDFAYKVSSDNEDLRSRFSTAAYSWVRNYYRDALDTADTIQSKSLQKVQDVRTLTDLLKQLDKELDYVTLEDICDRSGFGQRRVDSTFSVFDFNGNSYRDSNEEEVLYSVMNDYLTERQASILERSFGMGGMTKSSLTEIAEDMNISYDTVQMDRRRAQEIIKEKLSFKYDNNL